MFYYTLNNHLNPRGVIAVQALSSELPYSYRIGVRLTTVDFGQIRAVFLTLCPNGILISHKNRISQLILKQTLSED